MTTIFGELGESKRTPDPIPSQSENPKGLHSRYVVTKLVPNPLYDPHDDFFQEKEYLEKRADHGAEYFVFRLDEGGKDLEHIKACRIGIHAYADAIEHHIPELAKDLRERYPLL